MFYVKKLLSALVLPPLGPILLAVFGLWLASRRPRLGRAIAFIALAGLAMLSLPPVAEALMRGLQHRPPISPQQLARAQAIVVLGGGTYHAAPEYGGDTVSRWSLERVRYAVFLQKRSGLPILVTGGALHGERPEGETMRQAIERDFGGTVRWTENAARDTAENAAFSARLLKSAGISRIALVSHSSHLARAVELFAREGFEVIPAPTAYTTRPPGLFAQALPSSTALNESSNALREWLGIFVQQALK